MEIKIRISKKNLKPMVLWGTFILFFLFNVTLTLESYKEYEYIAGNIFLAITSAIGLFGLGLLFFLRSKAARADR